MLISISDITVSAGRREAVPEDIKQTWITLELRVSP